MNSEDVNQLYKSFEDNPDKASEILEDDRRCTILGPPSLATPGSRMIVLVCWSKWEGGRWVPDNWIALPVVAVTARRADFYSTPNHGRPRSPDPKVMEANGWHYEDSEERYGILILGLDGEIDTPEMALLNIDDDRGPVFQVVPAPWPPERDDELLLESLEIVREDSLARAANIQAKRGRVRPGGEGDA